MKTLLDLPSELIAQIATYLDNASLFHIRLVSKRIDGSILAYFGKQFFRKKGFLITTQSLEVLHWIAAHEEFRKYVQHVWFNPDFYTFAPPPWTCEDEYWSSDEETESQSKTRKKLHKRNLAPRAKSEAYQRCIADHESLLYTDALENQLRAAFCQLPNLQVIGMRRSEDHAPWGWHRLKVSFGSDPRILGTIPSAASSILSGPTRLFIAIIGAVASANRRADNEKGPSDPSKMLRMKRFYTDAIEIDNIIPDSLPPSILEIACRDLLYLELNASRGRLTHNGRPGAHRLLDSEEAEGEFGSNLANLFQAVPQLREIGLQIFPDLKQSHMVPPFARDPNSWRQSYTYLAFQRIAQQTPLAHLTRIKLEKITACPSDLIAFLQPSASILQSLKLRDLRLLSSTTHPRPWHPVFSLLQDSCPALTYLLLYHLLHEHGGVSFIEHPPTPAPYPNTQDNPPFGNGIGGIGTGAGAGAGGPGAANAGILGLTALGAQGLGGFDLPSDERFTRYEHLALEARGYADVEAQLANIVENHWYHQPIFSYALDEAVWHTDTSDEEW